ncbi:cupin domain-containing protein [Mesorhizobium sp. WSM4307]|uniref:cupin domain-containing protein n=1 Tax=unclassified Mesorhizobium TaxID=325217 RepID=UPI000BAEF72D|nr:MULTISPECIES: cupin domain-containing protein [unclassified Mesorhizobium]PBB22341.1 MerR family transcriptional regulator [Mesorhizobium sp. WSM4304]PBB74747.1 MerR family transcriptional regulator [Mesorhizobium sp. WSM4308]TRC73071.1 cupin domain-containing protein [Mesorhizobium sp. WSM4315]TRC83358.1 cupin domain-containing protein [Mesorhizobium sp. WSM4307]
MQKNPLKIAEAARSAGVSPSTLRLWEQQGLVEPIRTPSGQRLYDSELIERLQTIAWMRSEKGLNPAAIKEGLKDEQESRLAMQGNVAGDDMPIGMKVRSLRRQARQTLQTVARATGTSMSQLSTFERTSQGISITALHDVAKHLGTTVADLSGQQWQDESASLVRSGEWVTWPTTSSGVTIHALVPGRRQMECHRFDLAPGASSEGSYRHEGEEFIFVLAGTLQVVLDGDQFFELRTGDSFYFESNRPHSWRNLSDSQTMLIWINTPATF